MNAQTKIPKAHGISWLNGHKNEAGELLQGESWNPVTGCDPVSEGCDHCYAKRDYARWNPDKSFSNVIFHPERLDKPLRMKKGRAIFVNSMSDLFHEKVTSDPVQVGAILGVMAMTPHHKYFVLTKRDENMKKWFDDFLSNAKETASYAGITLKQAIANLLGTALEEFGIFPDGELTWPLPNVAFGVTAENQEQADQRIPILLELKEARHIAKAFVSVEPMLGAINLTRLELMRCWGVNVCYSDVLNGKVKDITKIEELQSNKKLDWVICGGESGPNARPMHPDWARSLQKQCEAAGTPFYFKQWGEFIPSFTTLGAIHFFSDDFEVYEQIKRGEVHGSLEIEMVRVGKKKAGDLLDGKQYHQLTQWD